MSPTIETNEFLAAMKSLKRAKNFFSLLIILALLVQGACFVAIYFFDTEITNTSIVQCNVSTQPCNTVPPRWYNLMIWAFPVSKLVALFSGGMLVLILMYTGVFALSGGGAGVVHFISASLWGIFLFALVTPWQEILRGELFTGALYNLDELSRWLDRVKSMTAADGKMNLLEQIRFFARFLGYPFITLLVLIMMLTKYAKGYKQLAKSGKKTGTTSSQPQI